MARTETTTLRNAVHIVRESGRTINGPWSYYNETLAGTTGNGTSTSITKGDIVKTPVGMPRKPLPYQASGVTAANMFVTYRSRGPSAGIYQRHDGTGSTGRLIPGPLPTVLPFDEGAIAAKKIRMLKQIGDQKWSIGETLIESREAVDMIAKSARTLQRALMAASRKDWRRVAQALGVRPTKLGKHADSVANGWLAYHFGWAPVVSDMANAMIYLSGIDSDAGKLTVSAASSHEQRTYASYAAKKLGLGSTQIRLDVSGRQEVALSWKARVTYSIRISSLRELQRYGLIGLSTPWAVMPASYILDWIIPVGDYLAAVDATAGLQFDSGFETRFARSRLLDLEGFARPASSLIRVDRLTAQAAGEGSRFTMSRTKWLGLAPPFYVKDPLDLWKATTSLALFKRDAYGIRSSMSR